VRDLLSLPELTIDLMYRKSAANDRFFGRVVLDFYRSARKRHPKLPLVWSYRHGVAACVLPPTFDDYFVTVEGSARRNFKKARRKGYSFQRIAFNDHLDDIAEIRRSAEYRQGRLPEGLHAEPPRPCADPESRCACHDYPYFGLLRDGKAYAYAGCLVAGELCLVEQVLGHKRHQQDGIVPMLLMSIAGYVLEHHPDVRYYAYGTYFGAGETMRRFKAKLGFLPCRVTWVL
jgi:hypothetical protein